MLEIFNTLSRKKEKFIPMQGKQVKMYACGPTVYHYAHIGNMRAYVFEDILRRTLEINGFDVQEVINITDVGHLTSDGDEGEDKMEKGANREGKSAWQIADFYTLAFQQDLKDLNILQPHIWSKATAHIHEQIQQVQILIDKGFTYETKDGIYFDTTKIDDYGKLANLKNQKLKSGARVEMGDKKNSHDFALWKFSQPGEKRQMEWPAFGRLGFPGWHIECTAMSMKYLGEQFDIHCGGIDHIPVHHTNEIAQAESITEKKPWVKYWLHNEHLLINNANDLSGETKMAKSGENFITVQTLKDKGFSPLAYRYFLLQAHYRKQLTFSYEALQAAQNGLENLYAQIENWLPAENYSEEYCAKFLAAINDDLNTPAALSVLSDLLKSQESPEVKKATILYFDKVLGLNLNKQPAIVDVPGEVQELINKRALARDGKNWAESDKLRDEIAKKGFSVEDTPEGQKISKK